MAETVIVVGIDEAGYGPLLGPLVVSATAFELPVELAEADLWGVLRRTVARTAAPRMAKIPILDSKKLYQRQQGLERLERAVLAVVSAWRGAPPTLRGLLGLLGRDALTAMQDHPWYQEADPPLPLEADAVSIRIASRLLAADLEKASIRLGGLWSEVLTEGRYNRLVTNTQNKAVVLSGLTLRLIQRVAEAFPLRRLRIAIDKQGGRAHYGPLLLRAFEGRRLKILAEDDKCSTYELTDEQARWEIGFYQGGESRHLGVALASMVSKYLRESLMFCFNAYWTGRVPGLQPTAGYYEDGMRFLRDLQPHLSRFGLAQEMLMRQR